MVTTPGSLSERERIELERDKAEEIIDEQLRAFYAAESCHVKQTRKGLKITIVHILHISQETKELISTRYMMSGWKNARWEIDHYSYMSPVNCFILIFPDPKPMEKSSSDNIRRIETDPFVGPKNPRRGFVYLFKCNDRYKIGRTKNPTKRLAKMAGAIMPFKIERLHAIPCKDACATETELHRRFADKREQGEWFNLTEEDIAYLKELTAA